MQITIKAKQAGRKHSLISDKNIEIGEIGAEPTLAELLKAVVTQQVCQYNRKTPGENLLAYLTEQDILAQANSGKIGFGAVYSHNKADLVKAQDAVLQAFQDGMFAVFADENEIQNLDEVVNLKETAAFTFIRLTFLAGSFW